MAAHYSLMLARVKYLPAAYWTSFLAMEPHRAPDRCSYGPQTRCQLVRSRIIYGIAVSLCNFVGNVLPMSRATCPSCILMLGVMIRFSSTPQRVCRFRRVWIHYILVWNLHGFIIGLHRHRDWIGIWRCGQTWHTLNRRRLLCNWCSRWIIPFGWHRVLHNSVWRRGVCGWWLWHHKWRQPVDERRGYHRVRFARAILMVAYGFWSMSLFTITSQV